MILKMEFFIAFKNSLLLPKKKAVFRLNRISMRNTLVYLFLVLFLALSPNFILSALSNKELLEGNGLDLFLLQLIVLYPMVCIFLGIVVISLLAGGGMLLKGLFKRKLAYQQLWKMSVFALTIPLILFFIISFLELRHWMLYIGLLVLFYLYITFMIMVYPKRK